MIWLSNLSRLLFDKIVADGGRYQPHLELLAGLLSTCKVCTNQVAAILLDTGITVRAIDTLHEVLGMGITAENTHSSCMKFVINHFRIHIAITINLQITVLFTIHKNLISARKSQDMVTTKRRGVSRAAVMIVLDGRSTEDRTVRSAATTQIVSPLLGV